MSLGLYIAADLSESSWTGSRLSNLLPTMGDRFAAIVDDPGLYELLGVDICDGRLYIHVHPAEESIEFVVTEDGRLLCSARTSGAGPGYHAWLVGTLERLGEAFGFQWDFAPGDLDGDETGYALHRSFDRLQQEMTVWLRAIATEILELEGEGIVSLGLNLAGDLILDPPELVVTPLGPRSREWFETAATEAGARAAAPEHFPWWNEAPDAEMWTRCGLVIAWCDVGWSVPIDDEVERPIHDVLTCFDRARALDANCELPESEIDELEALLAADPNMPVEPPPADWSRIGYRRHAMYRPLGGGWRVVLPGYFEVDEDDGSMYYAWGPYIVIGTAHTLTEAADKGPVEFLNTFRKEFPANAKVIEGFDEDPPWLAGKFVTRDNEDYEPDLTLTGFLAAPSGFCEVTFSCTDLDQPDWGHEVWKTIEAPPVDG